MNDTVFSLAPPLLAITLAIVTRRVYLSLFAGVAAGAVLAADGDVLAAGWRILTYHTVNPFRELDRLRLLAFTTMIGATVALMTDSGGTRGFVNRIVRLASTGSRAQVLAGLAGLLIFFDDYANCLIVGPAFIAVFARHGLSRAKLAYIVDSTAASVSSAFFISTWIGYEVGLIGDALKSLPDPALAALSPYGVFLSSIPYRFYLIFAIALVFVIGFSGRDFGPMAEAEASARKERKRSGELRAGGSGNWLLAAVPTALLLLGTIAGLAISGRAGLAGQGRLAGASFTDLVSAANSYRAMFWASLASFLSALALSRWPGGMRLHSLAGSSARGAWYMIPPLVILVLAWALGDICRELETGRFVGRTLAEVARPWMLPTLVFVTASGVSFSTGTSFGTMAIFMPVSVPLAAASAAAAGLDPAGSQALVVLTVASVLAGAVFGDHCSVISDTTILSATATGCGLIEHFRTQMPYALLAGTVAVIAGTLPAGLGISPWLGIVAGLGLLVAAVRLLGRG